MTPQLLGFEKAGKLPFASSLCGACSQICPVKVDLAHQLVRLRARSIEKKNLSPAYSRLDALTWRMFAIFMQSKFRYNWAMLFIRWGAKLALICPKSFHPWLLGSWTRGRAIPRSVCTFRSWWDKNRK